MSSLRGPASSRRIGALDGLRLVAALMVVAHHWIGQGSEAWEASTPALFPGLHPFAAYGWMGVQLFFLISGFVICMSSWDRSLGEFFTARVARLYPAYWVAVIATTCVLTLWPAYAAPLPWHEVLLNLTMLQESAHARNVDQVYWTLAVELRFYLLFALCVVWRGVTYRRVVLFCVLWTIASLMLTRRGLPLVDELLVPEHSMYFVAGIALFLMHRFGGSWLLWGIVAVSWARAQFELLPKVNEMSGIDQRQLSWVTATLVMSAFFLLMFAVASGALRSLHSRILTTAGAISYPLYLLHMSIGWTAIRYLHRRVPAPGLLAGLLVEALLISWCVHQLIEQPVGRVLRARLLEGIRRAHPEARTVQAWPEAPVPAEPSRLPSARSA